jgi:hypothetical protein
MHISYYDYEGVPCRVVTENEGNKISAEGYFLDGGFRPISVTPVINHGTRLTENEFKTLVAGLRKL